VQAAENELRAMETALARLRLDLEEIQISSTTPRNDLQAPLSGKRDFVRERLQLDLALAQRGLAAAEQGLAQVQSGFDVGTGTPAALLQAQTELSQTRAQMEQLRSAADLRQRLLKGEIKAEELSSAFRRMELRVQGERLDRELTIARRRVDEVRRLMEVGQATPLEVKRAEVELLEREIELKSVRRELDMIVGGRK
jgi:replicative DNA helicase